jgi:4-hydroxy-3-methylbut-2-enyl diphosphate reductase
MEVLLAEAAGMCFGVRDALAAARGLPAPGDVTIRGEIVHNEAVIRELDERGFRRLAEGGRDVVPATPRVLVTAHGVSERERQRLLAAGKDVIDTTCPLVARVHQAAARLEASGCHVLVIGKRGHVEVEGICGDLESFAVIESPAEVTTYPQQRLGIVSQTTASPSDVKSISRAIRERNPHAEIQEVDTVCQPTRDRQNAVDALLPRVDVMVVVGGRNSNNTQKLVSLCRIRGVAAYHVQSAADLDPQWFAGCRRVGLTAGTSTLDSTLDEVHRGLLEIAGA